MLSLPFLHKEPISFLDNLFTATSAISTTGLATVGIADSYNFFGQLVLLVLFQVGGIGYMTLTTYYLLFTTQRITPWHQKVIGAEFTMPKSIRIRDFLKSVVYFTVVMEALGAICFTFAFEGAGMPFWEALWQGIFHSVSAFCTAGFALSNDSFVAFQDDAFVNGVISTLAIAGSLGFIVVTDLWYVLTRRSKGLTFTSKIILYGFLALLGIGTVLIYLTEPLVSEGGEASWLASFFAAMTAMTTVGFNTLDTGSLSLPILLLVIFLMYIGASPSGTAGGMKITTLTAMVSILKSRLRGHKEVTFLHKRIPAERLFVATSTFIFYTSLIFLFCFLLAFTEDAPFDKILFEVSSALGTVGLSAGLTGELSEAGKALMIVLMFIGRVGVLTFGFALLAKKRQALRETEEDDLAV